MLVFQHHDQVPLGRLGDEMAALAVEPEIIRPHLGEPIPTTLRADPVVSLGGLMGAYDTDEHPWLDDEKRYLAGAVEAGVPVLGICLGCQLLADALGGRAYRSPRTEIGMITIDRSPAGLQDPVVGLLDAALPVWHQDTWDLPPGATLLATSSEYPQAFRMDSALGIQPHPEVGWPTLQEWRVLAGDEPFAEAGVDPRHFLAQARAAEPALDVAARAAFRAWLEMVQQSTGSPVR